jgi:glyoxylase-like metal-dependent hydrolase (beta-lactamase superfamily II)
MPIRRVAEDVFHIALTPRDGSTPTSSATSSSTPAPRARPSGLIKALHGHAVGAHALTHGHPDHAGGSGAWSTPSTSRCGSASAIAPRPRQRPAGTADVGRAGVARLGGFEAVGVARALREGDDLGHGFTVLETPGHSDGHVAFWRERDRTLVLGDVLFNLHPLTTRPGLREPPRVLTRDPRSTARARGARRPRPRAHALRPRAAAARPGVLTAFVAELEA